MTIQTATETEMAARRCALSYGSATEALAAQGCRNDLEGLEFRWALVKLSEMERGVHVREFEAILAKAPNAHQAWHDRLASARKRQADWLAELAAAQVDRVAA